MLLSHICREATSRRMRSQQSRAATPSLLLFDGLRFSPPPLPLSPLKMSSNIFFQINFLHEFSPVSFEIIFFTNVRKRLFHPLFYPFRWKNKLFRNISHDICGGEGEGILRNDVSKRVGDGWGGWFKVKDEHRLGCPTIWIKRALWCIFATVFPAKDTPIRISDRVCLQGVGTKLFGSVQSQPLKKINNVVIVSLDLDASCVASSTSAPTFSTSREKPKRMCGNS